MKSVQYWERKLEEAEASLREVSVRLKLNNNTSLTRGELLLALVSAPKPHMASTCIDRVKQDQNWKHRQAMFSVYLRRYAKVTARIAYIKNQLAARRVSFRAHKLLWAPPV